MKEIPFNNNWTIEVNENFEQEQKMYRKGLVFGFIICLFLIVVIFLSSLLIIYLF